MKKNNLFKSDTEKNAVFGKDTRFCFVNKKNVNLDKFERIDDILFSLKNDYYLIGKTKVSKQAFDNAIYSAIIFLTGDEILTEEDNKKRKIKKQVLFRNFISLANYYSAGKDKPVIIEPDIIYFDFDTVVFVIIISPIVEENDKQ